MKPKMRQDLRNNLTECRAEVQNARESGEPRQISLALTALGYTLFQLKQYEEGLAVFDEAVTLAADQEDIALQAHCLGIKSLAYQDIKRYPDAFQVAESIRVLAEQHAEIGMLCDALTSQGQILADSGEPIVALEKLREARQRSQESGDLRRQMNVLGALGNLHLMMASIEESLAYFDKSLALARELGDRQAELGYLGNKGSILAWHEQHEAAAPVFEETLALAESLNDAGAVLASLRRLAQSYSRLDRHALAEETARRGLGLAEVGDDVEAAFDFYEVIARAAFHLDRPADAQEALQAGLALARTAREPAKEREMLINLGEAYLVSGQNAPALDAYRDGLVLAERQERTTDVAYLNGRIGAILADLGRVDEALPYHEQALALARQHKLPDLEGEQLCMLALAGYENQQPEQAIEFCQQAIAVYGEANLGAEAERARQLLAEISAAPQS